MTPLAQAVPRLVCAWQALGQPGDQAELLCVQASLQQLAMACRVLSWCKLGRRGDGEIILDSKWHTKRRNRGAGRWWFALGSRVEVLKAAEAVGIGSWESHTEVGINGCRSLLGSGFLL